MEIFVGDYKNSKIGLIDGTRKITILNFPNTFNYKTVLYIVNQTGINNGNKGIKLAETSWFKGTIGYAKFDTAPAAALTGAAGNINVGTHVYVCTFVTTEGEESVAGPVSSVVTVAAASNAQVSITCPAGPSGTSARNIYRSLAGTTTPLYYVGQIADNVAATAFVDNLSDATITATGLNPPTISNNYDFDFSTSKINGIQYPPVSINDDFSIRVNVPNDAVDQNQNVLLVQEQSPAELPPSDTDPAVVNETNIAINTYFFPIPQSAYRNFIAQIKATCSVSPSFIKVWGTLDPAAAEPATGGSPSVDWVDLTTTIFGVSVVTIPAGFSYQSPIRNWAIDDNLMPVMYDRFLVQYQTQNATNFLNINTRKF